LSIGPVSSSNILLESVGVIPRRTLDSSLPRLKSRNIYKNLVLSQGTRSPVPGGLVRKACAQEIEAISFCPVTGCWQRIQGTSGNPGWIPEGKNRLAGDFWGFTREGQQTPGEILEMLNCCKAGRVFRLCRMATVLFLNNYHKNCEIYGYFTKMV
jgi:hypothetical protein